MTHDMITVNIYINNVFSDAVLFSDDDYNITKIGSTFVFENGKYAVALEKV